MKKFVLFITSLFYAFILQANPITLTSGTYTADYSGNQGDIIIAANANVILTTAHIGMNDSYEIIVNQGATLSFPNGISTNNSMAIAPSASVKITGDFSATGGNQVISVVGALYVSGKTTIHKLALTNCSFVQTKDYYIDIDNTVSGSGVIYITGLYDNQGNSGWSGHPLSSSSNVWVNNNTTLNLGNAQHTQLTSSTCSSTLPVMFTSAPKITPFIDGLVTIQWGVAQESDIKQYNVEVSKDGGKTWTTVSTAIPSASSVGSSYSVNVKIN